jgi:hypothetical protein
LLREGYSESESSKNTYRDIQMLSRDLESKSRISVAVGLKKVNSSPHVNETPLPCLIYRNPADLVGDSGSAHTTPVHPTN